MEIKEILDFLADEESAGIAPPASEEDLEQCRKILVMKGFPPIPQEYLDFLRICNGFVYGVHFFGTKPVPDTDPEHTDIRDDLITANEDFAEYYGNMAHCLLIGDEFNHKYVYDTKTGLYRAWDTNAGLWDDYESFENMFDMETA